MLERRLGLVVHVVVKLVALGGVSWLCQVLPKKRFSHGCPATDDIFLLFSCSGAPSFLARADKSFLAIRKTLSTCRDFCVALVPGPVCLIANRQAHCRVVPEETGTCS